MEILSEERSLRILTRMAWQIYEQHQGIPDLVLAGIRERGYRVAEKLAEELSRIAPMEIHLQAITINKQQPSADTTTIEPAPHIGQSGRVIVVDDVLNTGRTLGFAILPYWRLQPAKLQIAVLVDRNHRNFPLSSDFTGMSLATTLQEHVEVMPGNHGGFTAFIR